MSLQSARAHLDQQVQEAQDHQKGLGDVALKVSALLAAAPQQARRRGPHRQLQQHIEGAKHGGCSFV